MKFDARSREIIEFSDAVQPCFFAKEKERERETRQQSVEFDMCKKDWVIRMSSDGNARLRKSDQKLAAAFGRPWGLW